ncbi:MAG: dihydropyrimidine dehydrogenase [Elusimicrobia bacterium RIFOXYA12_FULL_51_18]|nr:MAG: dihydropyrimidine dehydrogenase [Elusimicrobia bacterium RIFOXYA12_FULL_51_18]OGS28866.1 MAG: dihydropyrimidine dehydrogenase [Elusimicrobia bacterium RIFOXYA2_FULL_53_38]
MPETPKFLSDAQLKAETERCLYCEEKPCKTACPADCSPADFIMAVKAGEKSDFKKAAKLIMGSNTFGGVCGAVCPDWFCVKACSRKLFDNPINIPSVQATVIRKAKEFGVLCGFKKTKPNGKRTAVIGAGPAGLGAAAVLAQLGYKIDIYEKDKKAGGACRLIPDKRLNKETLRTEIEFIKTLGDITLKTGQAVKNPAALLKKYPAVIVTAGVEKQIKLNIPNEQLGIEGLEFLRNIKKYKVKGRNVAVIGGGAVAADCAVIALENGAAKAEIFTRKNIGEIQLPSKELEEILRAGININGKSRITGISAVGGNTKGIIIVRLDNKGKDIPGTAQACADIDLVVLAIKNLPVFDEKSAAGLFCAGDAKNGPSTVVESVASGKNAAMEADAFIRGKQAPAVRDNKKSAVILKGRDMLPVGLTTDFFGRKINSPFIISASPHSDGYDQVKLAYEAGWPGVVMKTSFDGLDIHIPSEYMFTFNNSTYGNSDNVSGHPLNRVCGEIRRLVKEYPDRLTAASTGGPVTGNDEFDRKGWQSNTRKLEQAGAMAVEYSLSCPQGGDGTKGDIVSQDPELAAKIIGWVMEISDPDVPKLFKLTGAVTSIYQVVDAIRKVYKKYPGKKAGITLANSFPALAFRKGGKGRWEEGVIVGMSGEGVAPISNLTLSKASKLNVPISGNGGPMDYKAAAHFLALGARSVQFCTIVMKYGFGIIDELNWGLSHLLEEKGLNSVEELIGIALPNPVTGFMELSSLKGIPEVNPELCMHCGNCARCGYLAMTLDGDKIPGADASKCIGCSLCVKKCFAGALSMRKRTAAELKVCPE